MLDLYGQRLGNALPALFPEIGLDGSRFTTYSMNCFFCYFLFVHEVDFNLMICIIGNWKEESKRRAVLEDFAKANHFDPLKAEHWKSVWLFQLPIVILLPPLSLSFSLLQQVARHIIRTYYNGSLSAAVVALFPEIGHLDQTATSKSLSSFSSLPLLSSLFAHLTCDDDAYVSISVETKTKDEGIF